MMDGELIVKEEEIELLKFARSLTKASQDHFCTIFRQFVFKFENSDIFRTQCRKQDEAGFNPVLIWMEKKKFVPIFKNN